MEDTITTAEAALILRRSPSWLSRKVKAGELIPARQLPGATGAFLFGREAIEALAKGDSDDA